MLQSKIGLGTVQFGSSYGISNRSGKTPAEEVENILRVALSWGIDTLDTASAYGDAETVLGQFDLSRFRVISKFLPPPSKSGIRASLSRTLERLKIPKLYALLAHRPAGLLDYQWQWEELLELKERNFVNKIGFSLNRPEEGFRLLDKGYYPDLVQVPYNYFDNRFVEIIMEFRAGGCEIHARSAFLQGLLLCSPDELGDFFDEVRPAIASLQAYQDLPAQLLKYCLQKNFIDRVVIGVNTSEQLLQNLNGVDDHACTLPPFHGTISDKLLTPSNWPKAS